MLKKKNEFESITFRFKRLTKHNKKTTTTTRKLFCYPPQAHSEQKYAMHTQSQPNKQKIEEKKSIEKKKERKSSFSNTHTHSRTLTESA